MKTYISLDRVSTISCQECGYVPARVVYHLFTEKEILEFRYCEECALTLQLPLPMKTQELGDNLKAIAKDDMEFLSNG